MDKLGKGMGHILGGTDWDGGRFHPTAQNRAQFKLMNCLFLEFST